MEHSIPVVVAALLGQFLLIGGLLIQRHRRRRAEAAFRGLSGRLIQAQEEERRRIARDLHDKVGQQVALLAIRIDQVSAVSAASAGAAAGSLRELRQRAVEIATEVRNLSRQLHSGRLEVLGLVEALRGHCNELVALGVRASFYDEDVPPSLPDDVELCLFRIVQEGLSNIVRHSGAEEAQVTLRARAGVLVLSVVDSGRGFDEATASIQGGLGLASMRERLRLINGELTVRTQPGHGTRLTARVPIPPLRHHMS